MKSSFFFGLGIVVGVVGVMLWQKSNDYPQGHDEHDLSDTIDQQLLELESRAELRSQVSRN